VIVLACVLDSALDVQPLSPAFEAFLSDSISLDIMSGKSLFQHIVSTGVEAGNNWVIVHEVPPASRSRECQTLFAGPYFNDQTYWPGRALSEG